MAVKQEPKNTRSIDIPFLTVVLNADEDFQRDKRKVVEYEFSNGKKFYGDPTKRGAYGE